MKIREETINTLNQTIQKYVDLFCIKHGLEFDFWVADLTGTVASFSSSYFFNFEDIRLDLEKGVDKSLIMEWYDEMLETAKSEEYTLNYYTFLKAKSLIGNTESFDVVNSSKSIKTTNYSQGGCGNSVEESYQFCCHYCTKSWALE